MTPVNQYSPAAGSLVGWWTVKAIAVAVLAIFAVEQVISVGRKLNRRRLYSMARARSLETGLPLLVIGDPHNGLASIVTGPDYGCGDVCLDLTGCPGCNASKTKQLKGRLEDILPTLADLGTGYVVYVSCVLEYVDDIDAVVGHLAAMDPRNLFIVSVEWYSPAAYFYPYFLTGERPPRNVIYRCPPNADCIEYKRLW
jgi:hypothetical protein